MKLVQKIAYQTTKKDSKQVNIPSSSKFALSKQAPIYELITYEWRDQNVSCELKNIKEHKPYIWCAVNQAPSQLWLHQKYLLVNLQSITCSTDVLYFADHIIPLN